jgi:hypothetical protein
MTYTGNGSRRSFLAWRRRFSAKLIALRGKPLPRSALNLRVLDQNEHADHVRQHIAYDSVPGATVTAFVLLPKDIRPGERRPAVLALHGHHPEGKGTIAATIPPKSSPEPLDDYGLAAVRAGFVTLCPDWWGWGERVEAGFTYGDRDMCNVKFMAAQMYGVSLLSLMISDGQAGIDVMAARNDVDPKRIAVMGNSFGGRMAMWLAAFDQRIHAAVCSGCLNCFRERSLKLSSCGAQFLPGLLRYGDVEQVFSLIASRPLMIISGKTDALLFADDRARMGAVIAQAYAALGASKNLALIEHKGGHYLPQAPALSWLRSQLAWHG